MPILNILLADDDIDDCLFFRDALEELDIAASLTTVNDGVQLMKYLEQKQDPLPDIIYLDLNMPLKNGYECLAEIKKNEGLKHVPVIIYSTCYDKAIADKLYNDGAHYYIQKPAAFQDLKAILLRSITFVLQRINVQPSKEEFIIFNETV
jgi:CheY-like chemotaxis protein